MEKGSDDSCNLAALNYPPTLLSPASTRLSVGDQLLATLPHTRNYGADMFVLAFPPHTIITMPALSPTMTAGNIGAWQKKAGDVLNPGDVLVEIETDKAQMDFEFQEEGVLAKILKESGEKDVAVGNVSALAPCYESRWIFSLTSQK